MRTNKRINLPCPKCHCQWSPEAVYCICGEKLQKRSTMDFMSKEFEELLEILTPKTNRR